MRKQPPARRDRRRRYTLVDWNDVTPAIWETWSAEAQLAHWQAGTLQVEEAWVGAALARAKPRRGGWRKEPDARVVTDRINAQLLLTPASERPPTSRRVHRQLEDLRSSTQELADKLACLDIDRWSVLKDGIQDTASAHFVGYAPGDLPTPTFSISSVREKLELILFSIEVLQRIGWPGPRNLPRLGPNERPGEALFLAAAATAFTISTGSNVWSSSPTAPMVRFLAALAEPAGFETSPDRIAKRLRTLRARAARGDVGHRTRRPFGDQISLAKLAKLR